MARALSLLVLARVRWLRPPAPPRRGPPAPLRRDRARARRRRGRDRQRPAGVGLVRRREAAAARPQAALDQCVAFELMAQEAESARPRDRSRSRRGDAHRAGQPARRARRTRTRHARPSGLRQTCGRPRREAAGARHTTRCARSHYVRVPCPEGARPRTTRGARARRQIAAALANERGLIAAAASSSSPTGRRPGSTIEHADVALPYLRGSSSNRLRRRAVRAARGRRARRRAVRTQWGWDVILLPSRCPRTHPTRGRARAAR